MNSAFKRLQLLPVLMPDMNVREPAKKAFRTASSPAATHGETAAASRSLPRPRADQSTGERALFAILALSAFFCVGEALAPMIQLSPAWPLVHAWMAQLAG